ncbi:hypothetical protein DUI87_03000 [Hirundo rustica rustica]|uniref:Uncharacterized protein n=1 Tax=Hirundo rustica rustica TaxID=333673 RepID=A0A3M0LSY9_HIRRU|nr:hypothetical protein DUI87_03000 [Hirundo rustica rustica]
MPAGSKMDPLLAEAESIISGNTSEITFKKGEKLLQSRQRKREEMLQAAEIPLQSMVKTMMKQAVALQLMETNSGADIHLWWCENCFY